MPVIQGVRPAATAEALMRSRYTAYVIENGDYLLDSWHESTRPGSLDIETGQIEWLGLSIVRTEHGQPGDQQGVVEFVARYQQQGKPGEIHEASRFIFENGRWFYLDGQFKPALKMGRNQPCFCGSGKKYKRCCGASQ